MNRLILRYGYQISTAILVVLVWVVAQRLARGLGAIIPLAVTALIVWPVGVFVFIHLWPRITVGGFKRVILGRGHLDVEGVFTALRHVKFPADGALSLEYEENPDNPIAECQQCLAVAADAAQKTAKG